MVDPNQRTCRFFMKTRCDATEIDRHEFSIFGRPPLQPEPLFQNDKVNPQHLLSQERIFKGVVLNWGKNRNAKSNFDEIDGSISHKKEVI